MKYVSITLRLLLTFLYTFILLHYWIFCCAFFSMLWGVTCFHIMLYLVLVSNWNYNELEPSFICCIILCPPACKVLFLKWSKRVYTMITLINKRVVLLPYLRWWNGLLIIKCCGKLLPWYKHMYVFQELYPSSSCTCVCVCVYTHTHTHTHTHLYIGNILTGMWETSRI
jgi:hypothetical protein